MIAIRRTLRRVVVVVVATKNILEVISSNDAELTVLDRIKTALS